MNDRPISPAHPGDADPVVASALRTLVPPPHRAGFWDSLDARLAAGDQPAAGLPIVDRPAADPSPTDPGPTEPPLAEVVPLAAAQRPRPGWWLAVAAALIVVVAAATLLRSSNTDLEITPVAPTTVPVQPPTSVDPEPDPDPAPSTTAIPGTVPAGTAKATTPSSAATRSTTTVAKPASLSLSPSGLGPLQLGMTTKQAAATGAVGSYVDAGSGNCGFTKPAGTYRAGDFDALFLNGRLARIYVQPGSRLRTPQGIGIGTPSSRLREVPGSRVESPEKYGDGTGTNVDITSGNVGYQFTVKDGTVQFWSVGTREGLELTESCS